MKIFKRFLNLVLSKSVYEQEEEYVLKNGYPDEDVIFADSQGRISRLVGKNTFLKQIELHKKYFNVSKKDRRR